MKKGILFTFLFLLSELSSFSQSLPYVILNNSGGNLPIWSGPGSGTIYTYIGNSKRLVAFNQSGSWYQVYIPTNGVTPNQTPSPTAWVQAGSFLMIPDLSTGYVQMTGKGVSFRQNYNTAGSCYNERVWINPGGGLPYEYAVTDNISFGSLFAVIGQQSYGGFTRYNIDLPNNCLQCIGSCSSCSSYPQQVNGWLSGEFCTYVAPCSPPNAPNQPSGATAINFGQTYTYTTNSVPGATSYTWILLSTSGRSFIPSQTTSTPSVQIQWTNPNTGLDILGVFANNTCGAGLSSSSLNIVFNSSCTTPPIPSVNPPTSITSNSFQANWNSSSGATSYHLDVSTSSSFSSFVGIYHDLNVGNVLTYPVSGLSSTTTYYYRVKACCTSCSLVGSYTSATTLNGGGGTLSVTAAVIPPFQREDDDFFGSVTIISNPVNALWHLEVDVLNSQGSVLNTLQYTPAITTSTQNFNTATDIGLKLAAVEGIQFKYYAVLNSTGIRSLATNGSINSTSIIEKKWDRKNISIYNENGEQFKLPLKYVSGAVQAQVIFCRDGFDISTTGPGDFSLTIPLDNIRRLNSMNSCSVIPQTFCPFNSPNNDFCKPINNTGYFTIDVGTDNNLKTVPPGELKYSIEYLNASNQIISSSSEQGYFELSKIGKVNFSGSNKAVVFIGGWKNNIYSAINSVSNSNDNSQEDWSIAKSNRWAIEGYDTYYISQNNIGYTQRNAYDIGLCLDKLLEKNPNIAEINLVCHSKAGLEVRALLSDFAISYFDFPSSFFDLATPTTLFSNFQCNNKIKKVSFLATPHNGLSLANNTIAIILMYELSVYPGFKFSPAYKEMLRYFGRNIIGVLNDVGHIPLGIQIANLTCYRSYISNNVFYNYNNYLNDFTDGLVAGWSSDEIFFTYTDNSPVYIKQMYQESPNINCHSDVHTNHGLKLVSSSTHASINCIPSNSSNLEKLVTFITGNPQTYNFTTPFTTCFRPSMNSFSSRTFASVLSGTKISRKLLMDSTFYLLGTTGENGELNSTIIPAFQVGDSLKLEASGYETLTLAIDNQIVASNKMDVNMLKSITATNKIKYPHISLVNQNPITNQSTIDINISAVNALSAQINNPLNQDSTFISFVLPIGNYTIPLDTGYNRILIRFIGAADTIVIAKDVYYFPGSLMNDNASDLTINTTAPFVNAKLYIDNVFSKDLILTSSTVKVLKGSREAKFSLFGYQDTIYTIDSTGIINLSMQPMTYASENDSAIVDFGVNGNLQYWKNVTVSKTGGIGNNLILKQCTDTLFNTGLVPMSRCFEFINNSSSGFPVLNIATCLDQITRLSKDSTYLLLTKNDSIDTKVLFDSAGFCNFDSTVQKLTCNSLSFDSGTVQKEVIRIMKRLAPLKITASYAIVSGDSILIPFTSLFSDPDSIHNDMTYAVTNTSPTGLTISTINSNIKIKSSACWAGNSSFSINATHDGLTVENVILVSVTRGPNWTDIVTGVAHTLALKSDGTLWSWGWNLNGQLGIGNLIQQTAPVQVGGSNWISVSTGKAQESHSVGIKLDGTLWAWGYNSKGQLGDGTTSTKLSPVQVGNATNWVKVSCGYFNTLAIKADGTLWAWGSNSIGQLGIGGFDSSTHSNPVQVGNSNNWVQVSCGAYNTIALKSDGTIWTWGSNTYGQIGDGTTQPKYTPFQVGISTNWNFVCNGMHDVMAIKTDGTLWAWGYNNYGQLGLGTSDNIPHSIPVLVNSDNDWKKVSCGFAGGLGGCNTLALKSNGTLWAWGNNYYRQLGDGTNIDKYSPIQITSQTNVVNISAGGEHTGIIKSDHTHICMVGRNIHGQLGDGTSNPVFDYECVVYTPPISITTDAISPLTYCAGSPINIPFTTISNYCDVFVAQLSNSSGSFASPVNLGSLTTSTSGTITGIIPANTLSGNGYRVRVVSSYPMVPGIDNEYNITINALPNSIITPNGPTKFCTGGSVTLNSNSGTGLSYVWKKNGVNISGATASSYTVLVAGSYSIRVTNAAGCSATSSPVVVTVNPVPTATITASGNLSFCKSNTTLTLTANFDTSFTYQWTKNNVAITGATAKIFSPNLSGDYRVVENGGTSCSATSAKKTVAAYNSTAITISANGPTTFCNGSSVFLSSSVTSGLTYQWKNNNANIANATSANYTASSTGNYRVLVTNANNCTSLSNNIPVNGPFNAGITVTGSLSICPPDSVKLAATPSTGNYTYQWKKNNANIVGKTAKTYWAKDSGDYQVKIVSTTYGCTSTSGKKHVSIVCPLARSSGTSIIGTEESAGISIHPNPTSGSFIIEFNSDIEFKEGTVELINSLGQSILKRQIPIKSGFNSQVIDLSNSPAGIYFINLNTGSGTYRQKLIKE